MTPETVQRLYIGHMMRLIVTGAVANCFLIGGRPCSSLYLVEVLQFGTAVPARLAGVVVRREATLGSDNHFLVNCLDAAVGDHQALTALTTQLIAVLYLRRDASFLCDGGMREERGWRMKVVDRFQPKPNETDGSAL